MSRASTSDFFQLAPNPDRAVEPLGAFEYLAGKSGAGLARLISGISIALLWFYFNGFFFRIQFKGWFRVRSATTERIVSIVASGILASGFWFAAQAVAKAIAANTK